MKRTKQFLSVLLAVMMLMTAVPVMNVGASTSTPYYNWKQYDSQWSGIYIGSKTIGDIGCAATSVAMLIVQAGFRNESNFDPGTFVNEMKAIGGFSNNDIYWGTPSRLSGCSGFTYVDYYTLPGTVSGNIAKIKEKVDAGYSVVVSVKGGGHYVAVRSASSSSVTMMDPGSTNTDLYGYYSASNSTKMFVYSGSTPTYNQPPTKPVVSVDKKIALINSDVTISFSSERASNYWIGIYSDGDLWTQDVVYGNSYTISYAYVGKYNIVVVARNNCGEATGYASFKLGHEGDYVPSNFTVSADKTVALRNETIKLSFSADDADCYWVGVYTSGNYCYVSDNVYGNTYSVALPWTGNYHATIVAINDCSSTTKYLNLTVVEKKEFSVTYNANGGTGAPSTQTKTYGNDLVLSNQKPSKSGYTFIKWNTKADGTGTSYNSGATYKENADLSLYAIWQQNHTHSYTSSITKAATCSAAGVETFTCSCGDSYTKPIAINPNNHVNTKNVAATASTCTVKGYSAGVYCNDCKQYISGHAEQPLAAHQTTVINAREATYDANGYTGDTYCTVCKQTLSYGSSIPKLTKPNEPTNPTQPTTQQQQQQSGNCKYCGGTHTGFPGIIIGFFHSILALFGLRK